MIPLYNLDAQPVTSDLSQQQVKAAINSGAAEAGWSAQDAGPGTILATYTIRVHTVVVDIQYTDNDYSIEYDSSENMKVYCSDKEKSEEPKITSPDSDACANGALPAYIHGNYRNWIDELNSAIVAALSSA